MACGLFLFDVHFLFRWQLCYKIERRKNTKKNRWRILVLVWENKHEGTICAAGNCFFGVTPGLASAKCFVPDIIAVLLQCSAEGRHPPFPSLLLRLSMCMTVYCFIIMRLIIMIYYNAHTQACTKPNTHRHNRQKQTTDPDTIDWAVRHNFN